MRSVQKLQFFLYGPILVYFLHFSYSSPKLYKTSPADFMTRKYKSYNQRQIFRLGFCLFFLRVKIDGLGENLDEENVSLYTRVYLIVRGLNDLKTTKIKLL